MVEYEHIKSPVRTDFQYGRRVYIYICDDCGQEFRGHTQVRKKPCRCFDCKRIVTSKKASEKRMEDLKIAYERGKLDMQKFVEDRCRNLGIDYTLIFTGEPK